MDLVSQNSTGGSEVNLFLGFTVEGAHLDKFKFSNLGETGSSDLRPFFVFIIGVLGESLHIALIFQWKCNWVMIL